MSDPEKKNSVADVLPEHGPRGLAAWRASTTTDTRQWPIPAELMVPDLEDSR